MFPPGKVIADRTPATIARHRVGCNHAGPTRGAHCVARRSTRRGWLFVRRAMSIHFAPAMNDDRRQILGGVRSAVVKLGTQLLSDEQGRLDGAFVATIAQQVASLRARG